MVDKKWASYLFQKRDIWYFSRHVPVDIRGHYRSERIVRSLRTKSCAKVSKTGAVWPDHRESVWAGIRLRHLGLRLSFEDALSPSSRGPALTVALET